MRLVKRRLFNETVLLVYLYRGIYVSK